MLPTGLGAERISFDKQTGAVHTADGRYWQRPEVIESIFYMWRATHDPRWREYGWAMWSAIEKYAKWEGGYSGALDANQARRELGAVGMQALVGGGEVGRCMSGEGRHAALWLPVWQACAHYLLAHTVLNAARVLRRPCWPTTSKPVVRCLLISLPHPTTHPSALCLPHCMPLAGAAAIGRREPVLVLC